jgi:hypothetical protein
MANAFEIRREVTLSATPAQVWEAIATESGLASWFMPFPMQRDSDLVEVWEPGVRLLTHTPPRADGSTQAFDYMIEARDGGSAVLRFVHSGSGGEGWGDEFEPTTARGWEMYLFTMSQYFEYFLGRAALYAQAEGPAVSADGGLWSRLLEALQPSGPLALGQLVTLQLPGTSVVSGVVDYLTPYYVGVRTSEALVRFHGRWPIGLTAAVSHHAYDESTDAAALGSAWKVWLASAFA